MAVICPVFSYGPPVEGVYTYYAERCPEKTPAYLVTNRAHNLGGCQANGQPGPDCETVPPPPGSGNTGTTATGGGTLTTENAKVDADLINRGLQNKVVWTNVIGGDAPQSTLVHTLNCRFWDCHDVIWRTGRLLLKLATPRSPAGGSLPPLYLGIGFELDEQTIPPAELEHLLVLPQGASRCLGKHLHLVDVGGFKYFVLTAR
jgi:hypothetical protein